MTKYVDAFKVIKSIERLGGEYGIFCRKAYDGFASKILRITDDIPAEDVAPVSHGKWIWDENGYDWGLGAFICSNCHLPDNRYNPYTFKGSRYCPNCGAKMDGKEVKENE